MNLEPAAQSLLEQFPASSQRDLDRRERRIEKFGQMAFGGFLLVIIVAVLGLFYTILDRMVFSGDQPLFGIALVTFILFAMLTLAYVVLREDLKEKRQKARSESPKELEMPVVTGRLLEEKEFEPIPAVTENTTDLLPIQDRER